MSKTPVKSSILLADFEDQVNQGLVKDVTVLGTDTTGTHVLVKRLVEPEKLGRRPRPARYMSETLLITDLTSFRIVRSGVVSHNLIASRTVVSNVTISPVLPNTTSFRALTTVEDTSAGITTVYVIAYARITSTSNIEIRSINTVTPTQGPNLDTTGSAAVTSATYPSDTQVDVGAGHSHATDAVGSATHSHSHTHTLSAHTHILQFGPSTTVRVFWFIVQTAA